MSPVRKILFTFLLFTPLAVVAQGSWIWSRATTCASAPGTDLGMIGYENKSANPGLYFVGVNLGDSICLSPYSLTNQLDSEQTFIGKYDTAGNILWLNGSHGGRCGPVNMTIDGEGNLLVLGLLFTDSVQFGTYTITNPEYIWGGGPTKNHCYFILKVDSNGSVIWAKVGGNMEEFFEGLKIGGITTDSFGYIYVSGSFDDSLFRVSGHTLVNSNPDSGDMFLVKYDPSGNYLWAKTFGGSGDDHGEQVIAGHNNRLYFTGFYSSATLPLGNTTLTKTGSSNWGVKTNVFVAELDTSGNVIWARSPIGNAYEKGFVLDHENNIYVGGSICDTFMAFGNDSMTNPELWQGFFLTKYDTSGTSLWTKFMYPLTHINGSRETLYEITVDPCDNVWAQGTMLHDSIGINDSVFIHTLQPGNDPMFFAGFSPAGGLLHVSTYATGGDDNAGLASDCKGNIYLAGDIQVSTLILGNDTLAHYGNEHMFVAKYSPGLGCSGFCSFPEKQNELTKSGSISIFPNPANSKLIISSHDKIKNIQLFDLPGKKMNEGIYNSEKIELDISHIPAGIYFIKINGTTVRKFIKE